MADQLSFIEFGRSLVQTGDLDPVYIATSSTLKDPDQLKRWLLSYMLFYHVGSASYLSEFSGKEFLDNLKLATVNKEPTPIGGRWPRASERRHYRGEPALRALEALESRYGHAPEDFIEEAAGRAPNCSAIREFVQNQRGFGEWSSFKLCDLIDRVMGIKVEITENHAMYETPCMGALLVYSESFPHCYAHSIRTAIDYVVSLVSRYMSDLRAPPNGDRPLQFAEIETMLCKYKGHRRGSYQVGKDIREGYEASKDWANHSETARKLFVSYARMR